MPQAASQADLAYDWELWIGRGTSPVVWTQIYGFESLPFPDQVPEDIDVTHINSPGRTRETIPGLIPVVDWSQDKQLWSDAGDTLLETLAALTTAGTREIVQFEFNLDPAGLDIRRTYRGYVNSFTPTGAVGEKGMASLGIKILDRQSTNPRTIAGVVIPSNTFLPAISGTAQVGQTLFAFEGVWANGTTGFAYQWQENISSTWTNISGATNRTLVVPGGSTVGRPLRVQVRASNSAGQSAFVNSPQTANVIS
jgi:hypothetical protein